MTTLACNLKEMAGDTRISWDEVGMDTIQGVKLFVGNGAIYGMTGGNCTGVIRALEWLQSSRNPPDMPQPPEYDHDWDWRIFELSSQGIAIYNEMLEREQSLEPMLALGSGRKVALYCMKYLRMSPAEAVREACKVDHHSELPIYTASLADLKVRRWKPAARPKAAHSRTVAHEVAPG